MYAEDHGIGTMKNLKDLVPRRKKLGHRIRARREEVQKTSEEVSAITQIPFEQIQQIEKGLAPIDTATEFIDIAQALETTPDQLLPDSRD